MISEFTSGGGPAQGHAIIAICQELYGGDRVLVGRIPVIKRKLRSGAQPLMVIVTQPKLSIRDRHIINRWAKRPEFKFNVMALTGNLCP